MYTKQYPIIEFRKLFELKGTYEVDTQINMPNIVYYNEQCSVGLTICVMINTANNEFKIVAIQKLSDILYKSKTQDLQKELSEFKTWFNNKGYTFKNINKKYQKVKKYENNI